jgi:hypothetical protein
MAVRTMAEMFEAVVAESERPKGGVRAPFHGYFAGAVHMPSVMSDCKWLAASLRMSLKEEP